ncbi:SRPBCC family protein [Gilvimarinus algae]|uniref:SRPBCC domain-containing protein n=1 Tax=Gilvimarinus algae TaxID=3058037 RepID=A0ABT8TF16_9GAMM|nr:SRPBCC domain-containing protein [Gilvimarinus sp. SDUM040014]MDO3380907.1 SRPBCC domain-containing protein [Gilvimarinus sp. SDUM040014]
MNSTNIEKSIFINASPEDVWPFLVEKDKLAEWYHPAEEDLKPDSDYILLARDNGGNLRPQVWGRVLEWNKPSRLCTTFSISPFSGNETIVTWILEPAAGGTRVSVKHSGIYEASGSEAMRMLQALDAGWDQHLSSLRYSFE